MSYINIIKFFYKFEISGIDSKIQKFIEPTRFLFSSKQEWIERFINKIVKMCMNDVDLHLFAVSNVSVNVNDGESRVRQHRGAESASVIQRGQNQGRPYDYRAHKRYVD